MSQNNEREFYQCWNRDYSTTSNSTCLCPLCPKPEYFSSVSRTAAKDFSIEAILSSNNHYNDYISADKIERKDLEREAPTTSSMVHRRKHYSLSRHSSFSSVYCKVNDNPNEEMYEDSHNTSKRLRTIFTPDQLERLEQEFSYQQYMVGAERIYLAQELGLSEQQVKVWFQNRRIKWRKQNLEKLRSRK